MLVFVGALSTHVELNEYEQSFLKINADSPKEEIAQFKANLVKCHYDLVLLLKHFEDDVSQVRSTLEQNFFRNDLLSVRITVPDLNKGVKYNLSSRLPGGNKPPVCLGCKAFFNANFPKAFPSNYDIDPEQRLTFVSYKKEAYSAADSQFLLQNLLKSCGVLNSPFSYSGVNSTLHRHIVRDPFEDIALVKSYIQTNTDKLTQEGSLTAFQNIAANYSSGSVDSLVDLLITASTIDGLKESDKREAVV
jgi:hypothetical protein